MSDMEDDIRAAMASLEDNEPEPVTETVTEVDPTNEDPVEFPDEGAEKANDGRERGPDGKFIAKQPETAQDTTDQPPKDETEPPEKWASRIPASWSPEAKAEFANLPKAVVKAIGKREWEINRGLNLKDQEVKRYEPLEQLIAPRRALWAAQGMDEASAIKTLLAAQDLLEKDPRQGLEFLARSYGVSMSAQPQQGQAQQPQPVTDSHPEIATLKQQLLELQSQVQTAQTAPIVSQLEAFQNDPANLYFENVRDDMAVLLKNGRAQDLKEAYDMACWMRPDIRPFLQPKQTAAPTQDRAAQARRAAVSVTGSPGNTPIRKSNGTIEDDIRAAFEEVAGSA